MRCLYTKSVAAFAAVVGMSIALLGCQGASTSSPPPLTFGPSPSPVVFVPSSAGANPSPPASPPASPLASPSAVVSSAPWSSLSTQRSCEAANPAYCVGFYGFMVMNGGSFIVGSLPPLSGAGPAPGMVAGALTPGETQGLLPLVQALFASGQTGTTCAPRVLVAGSAVIDHITRIDGGVVCPLVGSTQPNHFDVYLSPTADALDAYLTQLMKAHYPSPFP